MPAQDPTAGNFKQIRMPGGYAAVEVTDTRASLAAGDYSLVTVEKDLGVAITGTSIGLLAPPEDIRVGGIFTFNPFAYVPMAPTFVLSAPLTGLKNMQQVIDVYTSMMKTIPV